jgi:hypothetical protein
MKIPSFKNSNINKHILNKIYMVTVNTLYNKYNYKEDDLLNDEINKFKSTITLDIKEV